MMARVAGIQTSSAVWMTALLFVLALLLAPPAEAAKLDKPFRIGALTTSWGPTPQMVGLQQGLKDLGYVENVDYILGVRFTMGKAAELPQAARDLVGYGVDLLFCDGTAAAKAASNASKSIPIVFTSANNPIKNGIIASYAHPGGNITGLADLDAELSARRLQLFQQIVPSMKRILFVYDINDPSDANNIASYKKAAKVLGISLVVKGVNIEAEAGRVIKAAKKEGIQGIIATRRPNLNIMGFMIEATQKHNVPTMFGSTFMVEGGGFASYGPSWFEAGRLAARIVDKIVKGANPGEIPVEVNTRLEFAINLKAAKKMGLKINPEVLYLADRIIR